MTVKFAPRETGPLTTDEKQQLTDFFMVLYEWKLEEERNKQLSK